MKFSIVVYAAPYSTQASESALRFTRCLLESGHEIYRLFFYSDGVHNGNRLALAGQDEINIPRRWHELISRYELDAVVCVTSAIKRGIVDRKEAQRHDLDADSIQSGFEIGGLGQFIDAALNSDRVVSFG